MKKLYFTVLVLAAFISSCNKNETIPNGDTPIEVSVKVVDALCSNVILEIQDESFKKYGDVNFEFKGSVYNGAVLINQAQCLPLSIINNIYENEKVRVNNIFKVKLSIKPINNSCDKGTCAATFEKLPSKVFYLQ